jgi:hypothetical protein
LTLDCFRAMIAPTRSRRRDYVPFISVCHAAFPCQQAQRLAE